MFTDFNCSEYGAIIRYTGRSAAWILLLGLGILAFSKKPLDYRGRLAISWLLVVMLSDGVVPEMFCKGQAQWTREMIIQCMFFITGLVLACVGTYRELSLLRRAKTARDLA